MWMQQSEGSPLLTLFFLHGQVNMLGKHWFQPTASLSGKWTDASLLWPPLRTLHPSAPLCPTVYTLGHICSSLHVNRFQFLEEEQRLPPLISEILNKVLKEMKCVGIKHLCRWTEWVMQVNGRRLKSLQAPPSEAFVCFIYEYNNWVTHPFSIYELWLHKNAERKVL